MTMSQPTITQLEKQLQLYQLLPETIYHNGQEKRLRRDGALNLG